MDTKKNNNVDNVIESALKLRQEGNYKGSNALLEPLLKEKKTLSPSQECNVVLVCMKNYELLWDCKSALPHAKKGVDLSIQVFGKGSEEHLEWVGADRNGVEGLQKCQEALQ